MQPAERLLRLILRVEALLLLCALPAVVMPTAWMDAVAVFVGLAPLPRVPLVEYLTRSLSLVYVGWAPICWIFARDVRRYRAPIVVLAWLHVLGGVAFLILDLTVGMPLHWALSEGPFLLVLGVVLVALVRHVPLDGVS
jgi:hypothetical protein